MARTKGAKPCLSEGSRDLCFALVGARETLHMLKKVPWGSKVRGQRLAIMSLSSPRILCVEIHLGWEVCEHLRGGSLDKLARGDKTRWWAGKKTKTRKKAHLSLWVLPCIFPHVLCFSNKLFTFLFTFCLLTWIHSWQGRQELGIQVLASGPCGLVVRTPGPGTKILLPATACCCLLQVAAYCCVCPKSLGATVLIEFTD